MASKKDIDELIAGASLMGSGRQLGLEDDETVALVERTQRRKQQRAFYLLEREGATPRVLQALEEAGIDVSKALSGEELNAALRKAGVNPETYAQNARFDNRQRYPHEKGIAILDQRALRGEDQADFQNFGQVGAMKGDKYVSLRPGQIDAYLASEEQAKAGVREQRAEYLLPPMDGDLRPGRRPNVAQAERIAAENLRRGRITSAEYEQTMRRLRQMEGLGVSDYEGFRQQIFDYGLAGLSGRDLQGRQEYDPRFDPGVRRNQYGRPQKYVFQKEGLVEIPAAGRYVEDPNRRLEGVANPPQKDEVRMVPRGRQRPVKNTSPDGRFVVERGLFQAGEPRAMGGGNLDAVARETLRRLDDAFAAQKITEDQYLEARRNIVGSFDNRFQLQQERKEAARLVQSDARRARGEFTPEEISAEIRRREGLLTQEPLGATLVPNFESGPETEVQAGKQRTFKYGQPKVARGAIRGAGPNGQVKDQFTPEERIQIEKALRYSGSNEGQQILNAVRRQDALLNEAEGLADKYYAFDDKARYRRGGDKNLQRLTSALQAQSDLSTVIAGRDGIYRDASGLPLYGYEAASTDIDALRLQAREADAMQAKGIDWMVGNMTDQYDDYNFDPSDPKVVRPMDIGGTLDQLTVDLSKQGVALPNGIRTVADLQAAAEQLNAAKAARGPLTVFDPVQEKNVVASIDDINAALGQLRYKPADIKRVAQALYQQEMALSGATNDSGKVAFRAGEGDMRQGARPIVRRDEMRPNLFPADAIEFDAPNQRANKENWEVPIAQVGAKDKVRGGQEIRPMLREINPLANLEAHMAPVIAEAKQAAVRNLQANALFPRNISSREVAEVEAQAEQEVRGRYLTEIDAIAANDKNWIAQAQMPEIGVRRGDVFRNKQGKVVPRRGLVGEAQVDYGNSLEEQRDYFMNRPGKDSPEARAAKADEAIEVARGVRERHAQHQARLEGRPAVSVPRRGAPAVGFNAPLQRPVNGLEFETPVASSQRATSNLETVGPNVSNPVELNAPQARNGIRMLPPARTSIADVFLRGGGGMGVDPMRVAPDTAAGRAFNDPIRNEALLRKEPARRSKSAGTGRPMLPPASVSTSRAQVDSPWGEPTIPSRDKASTTASTSTRRTEPVRQSPPNKRQAPSAGRQTTRARGARRILEQLGNFYRENDQAVNYSAVGLASLGAGGLINSELQRRREEEQAAGLR